MIYTEDEAKMIQKMAADLAEMKEILVNKKESEYLNRWVASKDVPKILNICKKTWDDYRSQKIIPYSQFASKIWVKMADIEAFRLKHYIK